MAEGNFATNVDALRAGWFVAMLTNSGLRAESIVDLDGDYTPRIRIRAPQMEGEFIVTIEPLPTPGSRT